MLHIERFNRREDQQQPLTFGSKSEMACGLLLEKYIPEFELKTGETFQVPVALGKTVDFKIGDVYVEYHPINLLFEFDDRQALRQLKNACRHVKKNYRTQIYEAIKSEMAEKYYRRRKFAIDGFTSKDSELIVVKSPEEVYKLLIKRFAESYPKQAKFIAEFNRLKS